MIGWEGRVEADRFVAPQRMRITVPIADLNAAPSGPRDRQLLYGAGFEVLEIHDGHAFGRAVADGYCGYVCAQHLAKRPVPTHRVTTFASQIYSKADFKSAESMTLPFGAEVSVIQDVGRFAETAEGFIPKPHLEPTTTQHSDIVVTASKFLGAPYLWGGNSVFGIDCSGLVQAAFLLAGQDCPGDSDLQMASVTATKSNTQPEAGELFFWKGHVALVADADHFIHANAHHMAVVRENISQAIERIKRQGDGEVIARGRLI